MRGANDEAFEWLEIARQNNAPDLSLIRVSFWLMDLHDDPRWQPFLEQLGKSDEQIAEIEFNVQLPER